MNLRLVIALVLAAIVSLFIFSFMLRLVQGTNDHVLSPDQLSTVELFQPPPEEPEIPEPEVTPPPEVEQEPDMTPLAIDEPAPAPNEPIEQMMPTVEMGSLSINTANSGDIWSSGGAGADELMDKLGKDNQGYIEVIPFSTRQPNIPDLAWNKKINGWVLVAFNVTPKGRTGNIRVLDASPRGVFEEEVVLAVKDWRYSIQSNFHKITSDLVLTQKVELFWKDYPANIEGYYQK